MGKSILRATFKAVIYKDQTSRFAAKHYKIKCAFLKIRNSKYGQRAWPIYQRLTNSQYVYTEGVRFLQQVCEQVQPSRNATRKGYFTGRFRKIL